MGRSNRHMNFNDDTWVDLLALSGTALQTKAAPALRIAAINQLRHAKTPVARGFRGEYIAAGLGNPVNEFLNTQGKDKAWGTYIEATALAEYLNMHLVVIPVKNGVEQNPVSLHRTEDDNAPVIILRNRDNMHWESRHGNTLGDGNCLYNAFAQELKFITVQEQTSDKKYDSAIQSQKMLFDKHIKSQPKPSEAAQQLQAEKTRIEQLPDKIRQQIADDRAYALQLALEFANENFTPVQDITAGTTEKTENRHSSAPRLLYTGG